MNESFFQPLIQEDPGAKRKQALAQMLMQQGTQPSAKEPYGVLANMLKAYTGAKMMGNQDAATAGRQENARSTLSEAMANYRGDTPNYSDQGPMIPQTGTGSDRQALMQTMMQNPDTAGMASKMQLTQALTPTKYNTATVGDPNNPNYRQEVAYNAADPSKTVPIGSPYAQKAQVEINNGGQPPSEDGAENKRNKIVAEQVGVPLAVRSPWAHINDPKERDKARVKYGFEADKRLEAMNASVATYAETMGDIDRFLYLNRSNYTGKWMDVPGAKTVRSLGDPEFQEMQSISDKMTPSMRNGLPGSASERDTAMFRSATLGANKDQVANENVGMGLKVSKQNALDMLAFEKDYKLVNQHLEGVDSEWKKYIEANPIFDPKAEPGSYKLNENRMTYKQYFVVPRPKDDEEFAKLKKGEMFVDPNNGLIYRK